ncbi:MAG TPA: RomA family MBL fold metallo-hydrolase, partial [Acinetobacter nosocomialis]|nr:RomA family MBL fold metallo-hydrolase [Acinetobacter nosocomialis]
TLSPHAWNDPFKRVSAASKTAPFQLLTPIIGQPVLLDQPFQQYSSWWEEIK